MRGGGNLIKTDHGNSALDGNIHRHAHWLPVVGVLIPFALLLVAIFAIPPSAGQFLNISVSIWCAFACAPITSVCLALCWHIAGNDDSEKDPRS